MEFFATNEELAQLEARLAQMSAHDPARLALLVEIAWQIRQRDSQRAQEIIECAEALIEPNQSPILRLRILRIRAELQLLGNDFSACFASAEQARLGFAQYGDALGLADTYWLLAWLAEHKGEMDKVQEALAAMEIHCECDDVRRLIAQATQGRFLAFTNVDVAVARWGQVLPNDGPQLHPAARAWLTEFWGAVALRRNDYMAAITFRSQSYLFDLETGQTWRAVIAALNVGIAFVALNDLDSALTWMQTGLELARASTWEILIGTALDSTAEVLIRLQSYDAAHAMLTEALALMSASSNSRCYALALNNMGNLALARQQFEDALASFDRLAQRALALNYSDLLIMANVGQAKAWLGLGQPEAALPLLTKSVQHGHFEDQIAALRVLAQTHSRYSLALPPDCTSSNAALHYLQQALRLAESIQNYTMPSEFLQEISEEYAKQGDFQQAWLLGKQAAAAQEKMHSREVNNRAQTLEWKYQTEKAQLFDAHQRELALEAQRAEFLQQTSETLAQLSAIGQEITASLNQEQIFSSLYRHIEQLFEMTCFDLLLLSEDGQYLHSVFFREDGKSMPSTSLPLMHPFASTSRCARENREILYNYDPADQDPTPWSPGTQITLSAMFAPLVLAGKVMGVMTIQTTRANAYAYGQREQMIVRALCAYTAIALSNADAHSKLAAAHQQVITSQQQMLLQEKMAGLGTLTAGVAHEINNPTNFLHVAAQNQQVDLAKFEAFVRQLVDDEAAPEVMQGFQEHFSQLSANVATMLSGTERIKAIVRDLRSFTRLDEAEKKAVHIAQCLTSTLNLVRTSWLEKVDFITEFRDDPLLECWPALLNQVFMNLLVNGCQAIQEKRLQEASHALYPLYLRLYLQDEQVVIECEDSGTGISEAAQARIMEPFFTTKAVGEGTGLGLSIAFGIIEKHGGSLLVRSQLGQGSCFTIRLPICQRLKAEAVAK